MTDPDLTTVWQAHRAADDLSNSLAVFYEAADPAGRHELTDAQKATLAAQHVELTQLLVRLGAAGGRPAPADGADAALAALADDLQLHGRLADGYAEEDINRVFAALSEASGLNLVCLWDYHDETCCGGNSAWYAEDAQGRLWELNGDLYAWLSGQRGDPGPVTGWIAAASDHQTDVLPWTDGLHNYAEQDRV